MTNLSFAPISKIRTYTGSFEIGSFNTWMLLALFALAFTFPANEAEAMEPISLAMMAIPIALPIVKALLPYVIQGAVNMGGALFETGMELFNIFLLPIGLLETTVGAYWWFDAGVSHLIDGALAVPKTVLQVLLILPKTIGVI